MQVGLFRRRETALGVVMATAQQGKFAFALKTTRVFRVTTDKHTHGHTHTHAPTHTHTQTHTQRSRVFPCPQLQRDLMAQDVISGGGGPVCGCMAG